MHVLEWCEEMRLSKQVRTVHHDKLCEVFGNTGKGLAKWLFANLLTRSGHYVAGKQSFSYKLKIEGYDKIYRLLAVEPPSDVDVVVRKFGDLIVGSEVPIYSDKGTRRYHPVQNIKREIRCLAFCDWWDYDIESCAPSLVYQYAVRRYQDVYGNSVAQLFPAVAKYINEKNTVRQHFATLTSLDAQKTKGLVNSIFFRANMAPSHRAKVFQTLGCDPLIHQRLVNDEFVKDFMHDIREMWRWARLHDYYERGKESILGRGVSRRPTKMSQHRMAIYLRLEREVLDIMNEKLTEDGVRTILMHDGFMTKEQISVNELIQAVKDRTGFVIKLSENRLGTSSDADPDVDVIELIENDLGEADDELSEA